MRLCSRSLPLPSPFDGLPPAGFAASCTTQAELTPQDRGTLASLGEQLSDARDTAGHERAADGAASGACGAVGGNPRGSRAGCAAGERRQDAIAQCVSAGCEHAFGAIGYAVFLLECQRIFDGDDQHARAAAGKVCADPLGRGGGALDGQMGFVLVWDTTGAPGWKLGGFSARQGNFGGHDGVWYWTRARELARSNLPWAAWYCYDAARYLELPVDFLSSPNLDKLGQEQAQIKGGPGEDRFRIR